MPAAREDLIIACARWDGRNFLPATASAFSAAALSSQTCHSGIAPPSHPVFFAFLLF